jgi:hypothetical protein
VGRKRGRRAAGQPPGGSGGKVARAHVHVSSVPGTCGEVSDDDEDEEDEEEEAKRREGSRGKEDGKGAGAQEPKRAKAHT